MQCSQASFQLGYHASGGDIGANQSSSLPFGKARDESASCVQYALNVSQEDQPVGAKGSWSINAYLHLFEALLVLHDVSDSPAVWADIEAMVRFLGRFG